MKNIIRAIKDSNIFAYCQGFYERYKYVDGFGRTHKTFQDWNESYDKGANLADKILRIN